MKESLFTLEHARQLTEDTYELVLSGDTSAVTAPGQFVNIQLPGRFLRRPISICNWAEGSLLLLVKVVGEGTRELVRSVPGTEFPVLTGLGNGFDLTKGGAHPILLGGGIGIAPLYGLARRMLDAGLTPTVGLGFRSAKDSFYLEEFAALGCPLMVATEDGSLGTKGFVTDLAKNVPLRLRSHAHAEGGPRPPPAHRRAVQLRGPDGLRLRRLHGLLRAHGGRVQAGVQGRPYSL